RARSGSEGAYSPLAALPAGWSPLSLFRTQRARAVRRRLRRNDRWRARHAPRALVERRRLCCSGIPALRTGARTDGTALRCPRAERLRGTRCPRPAGGLLADAEPRVVFCLPDWGARLRRE